MCRQDYPGRNEDLRTRTSASDLRRRGLTLGFPTGSLSYAHDYGQAGLLEAVSAGAYSARYTYLANSPLVDTVSFKQGTATVMTTTRTYDNLNRLQTVSSVSSASSVVAFSYGYNDANQRVRATLADGSYWIYDYDALGQVISGKRSWADGTPVAGQQFEYGFDDIGNRRTTKAGGDSSGGSLRSASYTSDSLNRYASRDVPGAVDVLGTAVTGASVSVNGVTVTSGRKGEYYQQTVPVGNSAAAQWVGVTVAATQNGLTETQNGNVFVPKTREVFGYDDDGNLTQDGRWRYTWDAENRLVRIEPATAVGPQLTLTFTYDALSRRIRKTVTGGGSAVDQRFAYDGWNLVVILSSDLRPLSSFVWGLDLSGTEHGAGGVGGLLAVLDVANGAISGASYPAYDGNGNVVALLNAANGTWVAQYDYGPFGEPMRRTGPKAAANPFRFSTKYTDDETDLLYYGYRYYQPSVGRWLNRDPLQEAVGPNSLSFGRNAPPGEIDSLGLQMYGCCGTCGPDVTQAVQAALAATRAAFAAANVKDQKAACARLILKQASKGRFFRKAPTERYLEKSDVVKSICGGVKCARLARVLWDTPFLFGFSLVTVGGGHTTPLETTIRSAGWTQPSSRTTIRSNVAKRSLSQ